MVIVNRKLYIIVEDLNSENVKGVKDIIRIVFSFYFRNFTKVIPIDILLKRNYERRGEEIKIEVSKMNSIVNMDNVDDNYVLINVISVVKVEVVLNNVFVDMTYGNSIAFNFNYKLVHLVFHFLNDKIFKKITQKIEVYF